MSQFNMPIQPLLRASIVMAAFLIGGCAQNKDSSASNTDGLPPGDQLLQIYVPGSVPHSTHSPHAYDETLDPTMQAPLYTEDSKITASCGPNTTVRYTFPSGKPYADGVYFRAVMVFGLDIAKSRHIWAFNDSRTTAQARVLENFSRNGPSQPTNVTALVGMVNASGSTAPDQLQSFDQRQELSAQLAHNRKVLQDQNVLIRNREIDYGLALMGLFRRGLNTAVKSPQTPSLAELVQLERFRTEHIEACFQRTRARDTIGWQLLQEEMPAYLKLIKTVLDAHRDELNADLQKINTSADLDKWFVQRFGTPFLIGLVKQDPEFASVIQRRRQHFRSDE